MNTVIPITIENFTPTKVGAIFLEKIQIKEWLEIGAKLVAIDSCRQFLLGDWLNFGEKKYGQSYKVALEMTGYDYQSIRNLAWVCGSIELSRRRDNLSFGHHAEVAAMTPQEQDKWLALASDNKWSVADLRQAIRKSKAIHFDKDDGRPERNFVSVVSDAERILRHYIAAIPIESWSAEERQNTKNMLRPLVEVYEQL